MERLFLALSDRTRLRLLLLMAEGEVSVGFLADSLGESQPKVSRHLAYLRSFGLVTARRDGKRIYYSVADQSDEHAGRVLSATLGTAVKGLAPSEDWSPEIYSETYDDQRGASDIDVFLL